MYLSEFNQLLSTIKHLSVLKPNGQPIPPHFHITEMGLVQKNFIDCGNTIRSEKWVSFQIWLANDTEHRLEPAKLQKIIAKSTSLFGMDDHPIEIEFQGETIGKYDLAFTNGHFQLIPKQTQCLAQDHCGIPQEKTRKSLAELTKSSSASIQVNNNCC